MKKKILNFIKKNIKLIIIALIFILGIVIIVSVISIKSDKEKGYKEENKYRISDEVVEVPGTKIITSDRIKERHCLNDICVTNMTFYTYGKDGRIECTVKNESEEEKSGYIKIKVNGISLIANYDNLVPGKESKTVARYTGVEFTDIEDYTLEELTKKEKKNIIG